MSLASSLATAMSGLRANQAALSITSSNIANAQTPGYVAQSINQVETYSGDVGATVSVTGVNRELDQFVQTQLRTETSGGAYANQIANVLTQLQSIYGTPGQAGTLENAYSNFTTALQSLSDQFGQLVGADHGRDGGAEPRPAAQRHDPGHPDAAHQCRAGPQHFGGAGQRRDAADRADQHPAAGHELDRSCRRRR